MGPLSSLRKLSRERVPESAQWLPAGLETRGAQILTYFPETVAGYQGWADRAQQGSCSLWGPQLRGTSDFLGSKLQGAEERDPGVCGAVQSGDPQDVPPWGGQPRGSPPHCVLLANREMGSSVPRAQAQGPASGAFCPSVCWLQRFHFFLCTLLARPLDRSGRPCGPQKDVGLYSEEGCSLPLGLTGHESGHDETRTWAK